MLILSNALSAVMASDPGRVRQHNEDACAADVERGAFVVCDGVGGAAGGEVASRVASGTMLEWLLASGSSGTTGEERLRRGVALANQRVLQEARHTRSLRGMGTTLVGLLAEPVEGGEGIWGTMWLVNVGDSRCYRMRQGRLEQLTVDHSLVEEQVRAGEMTREQAEHSPIRNVITRAVGSYAAVEADIQSLEGESGDLYLLTTDGLTRELSDREIAGILEAPGEVSEAALEGMCARLIEAANEQGGGDNITCVLVHLKAGNRE
ncbi:MAG TPA: protein phosphatase 2C domain-containing protein [Granulicella sp.]|nr:protein phosphatase 2C domain-containing protein [Granulicella sp.]